MALRELLGGSSEERIEYAFLHIFVAVDGRSETHYQLAMDPRVLGCFQYSFLVFASNLDNLSLLPCNVNKIPFKVETEYSAFSSLPLELLLSTNYRGDRDPISRAGDVHHVFF